MSQAASVIPVAPGSSVSNSPSKFQRALYQAVVGQLPLKQISLRRFEISDSFSEQYWVVSGDLQKTPGVSLSLSLPELSQTVFLSLAGGFKHVFERLVCDINAISECNDVYRAGHAERLNEHPFNEFGWTAVLFARAKDFLGRIPNTLRIGGELYDFVVLIPITEAEYRVWSKSGYDGLRGHFAHNKRGVLQGHQRLTESKASAQGAAKKPSAVPVTPIEKAAGASRQAPSGSGPSRMGKKPANALGTKKMNEAEPAPPSATESTPASSVPSKTAPRSSEPKQSGQGQGISATELAALDNLERRAKHALRFKRLAWASAATLAVVAAMAAGLLPGVLMAAGVVTLVGAFKEVRANNMLE